MNSNNQPLPYGWIKETDQSTGREFYVDTKASPPRSIWTHPYEDEMFLREHPDVREKVGGVNGRGSAGAFQGTSEKEDAARGAGKKPKEGFLDKLKNKAITSMEKRNERKQQQMMMQQQMYAGQGGYGGGGMGMAGMPPNRYPVPQGGYPGGQGYGMGGGMPMGGGMMGGPMGGGMGMGRQRRGGGGGMALPLVGGLAGGLLLGDMLDNDHDHGDWDNNGGGGDWGDGGGGGDFGGGDFGGGDF